jgi:kojibiose phosphorylase
MIKSFEFRMGTCATSDSCNAKGAVFMTVVGEKWAGGDDWSIEETSYHPSRENIGGALFCIGNGFMGLRGSYEELGTKAVQGLYVAGIFRKKVDRFHATADTFFRKKYAFDEELMTTPWKLQQLQNLPDPLFIKIFIDGVPFRLWDGELLEYKRSLDLKTGLLSRTIRWGNGAGKISSIKIDRFCSMADRQVIVQRYSIVPENWSGTVRMESGIDAGLNAESEYTERIVQSTPSGMVLCTSISSTLMQVFQAIDQRVMIDGKVHEVSWIDTEQLRRYKKEAVVTLREGQTLTLEKFCVVSASSNQSDATSMEACAMESASGETQKGFQCCLAENEGAWRPLWKQADIRIQGDPEAQKFMRYSLFHLIIASPREDARVSIAAKALTGPGYSGHVFWDTDINIAPFYQWVFPHWAKGHCQYRYQQLDVARENARREGHDGARYPWCTLSGDEQAPVAIICGNTQIHIMPDIAYAMFRYVDISGDVSWWRSEGLETVTECARYMAERVTFNEDHQRYEIRGVGGPDEYHPVTNNNAYTNYLTAHLFQRCADEWIKYNKFEGLKPRLSISNEEVAQWKDIAEKMYQPVDPITGLIPQFDGFFDLKDRWEQSGSDWGGPSAEYHECKGIKQPDVLLLLALLPARFEQKHLLSNWDYYERFILHGSSLSPSIHALVAARLGLVQRAKHYFDLSAAFDFADHNKDTCQGLHTGNSGGLWQAVIYGFAGLEVRAGGLYFAPALPQEWTKLEFRIQFLGNAFSVQLMKDTVRIIADEENQQEVQVTAFDRTADLRAGETEQFNWSC